MTNLLYKELKLAAHPTLYVFMLMGALLIIPSYPYGVMFFFGCLAPFITIFYGNETRDVYYTALLPVRKRDVVKGICAMVVFAQVGLLVISIPFAVLSARITPGGNPVGIDANAAYYGFGLMMLALFDYIFLTRYFKTAYRTGKAFVLGCIPVVLGIVAMELSVHLPQLRWLDGTSAPALKRQLPVLIAGIALYIGGMLLAYHASAKAFDRVDL